jgi:hypothetical protein
MAYVTTTINDETLILLSKEETAMLKRKLTGQQMTQAESQLKELLMRQLIAEARRVR